MLERDNFLKQIHKAIKQHSSLTKEDMLQIAEHGADAGWNGFSY